MMYRKKELYQESREGKIKKKGKMMAGEDTEILKKQMAIRLKKMRRYLQLTREDVAVFLGITREQYKDIEMGKAELKAEQLETLMDHDFDAGYVLTGTATVDELIRKALSVMPDKDYDRYIGMLETTVTIGTFLSMSESHKVAELNKVRDILMDLAEYGRQNNNDRELRDLPPIRFLSEQIDAM